MKIASIALALLAGTLFGSAPATAASVEMGGNSTVTGSLLSDVMDGLTSIFPIMSGCREKMESIDRKILSLPDNPETKDGALTSGTIKERWDVSACGKITPVYVTIYPKPGGYSVFDISARPK